MDDTYKTLAAPSDEVLYKEKNSKFFGYAFPISSESEVKPLIEKLRKQHHGAVHFCFAWQLGTDTVSYRANDDGEPSHSAGTPIYGQIQSFGLTNILVVVVRFFGGVKLGVGGLKSAYKTAAQMALETSEIIEKTIEVRLTISFGYADMNKVMRIVREKNLTIVSQRLEENCDMVVLVRAKVADLVVGAFESMGLVVRCEV